MRAHRLVPLVLALLVAPSAAATHAEDGLPFSVHAVDARVHALDALADAPGETARFENATAAWPALVTAVRALAPSVADVLESYFDALTGEARGNTNDTRDLARAAAGTLRRDVRPAVEAWEAHPTLVLVGAPVLDGDAWRAPVVLVHPPPGGVGAFDVTLTVTGARVADASVETGEGDARADPATGTARLAAFDARALAGTGSAAASVVLGHVVLERAGRAALDANVTVTVTEVADAEGTRVPALGAGGPLAAHGDASGGLLGGRSGLVIAAGAIAAGGAMLLVRKLVKV